MFLHGDRIVGPPFDRGVVRHDDDVAARDTRDAGDQAGRRGVFLIDSVTGKR